MRTEVTRSVNAAPERVWSVLSDLERWPTWTESMRAVSYVEGSELAVGARVRVVQPRLPAAVWRVTRVEPGRSFEWQASGPGMRATAVHRVEAAGGGSTVTLSIEQTGLMTLLLGWWLKGLTNRYVNMEADGLKAASEKSS